MRIITRGDFDGLTCSVLLTEVHPVREIKFAHPKDAQDGLIEADSEDIVVNIPYVEGCGLWFDHHVSEEKKLPESFEGRFENAPSCARVIFNHYKDSHTEKLAPFDVLLEATDRLDSATLTEEDVTNPEGWILLGLTIDPRSGLGPEFRQYFRWLVEYIKEVPLAKVLQHPEVSKRTDRVKHEQLDFKILLDDNSHSDDNIIITDFRNRPENPVGNRFLVYTMYPECNVEIRLFDGHQGKTVIAVGHSIFNRTCNVNVGDMLKKHGGGGHKGAGTCQVPRAEAEQVINEIKDMLKKNEA